MPKIDPARAAGLLTTPEGCRVLDAAVARLVGAPQTYWSPSKGRQLDPYHFTTAGDGDPYARGDLVMAMWKALETVAVAVALEREICHPPQPTPFTITFYFNDVTSESADAPTPHRALVLALAAAGLLEEPTP